MKILFIFFQILCFSICIGLHTVCGQAPLQKLTIDELLPMRGVDCLMRDSLGFIWMGGKEGLTRYDGKNKKTYSNLNTSPARLTINSVSKIFQYNDGLIWIYGNKQINVLDPEIDSVVWHRGGENEIVERIFKQNGHLWMVTIHDSDTYVLKFNDIENCDTVHVFKNRKYTLDLAINHDQSKMYFLGRKGVLMSYSFKLDTYELLDSISLSSDKYYQTLGLEIDEMDRLWVVNKGYKNIPPLRWDENSNSLEEFPKIKNSFEYINKINDRYWWFYSKPDNNILLLDMEQEVIQYASVDSSIKNPKSILKISEDLFWVSTPFKILEIKPYSEQPFINYLSQDEYVSQGISTRGMIELPVQNKILVTTYNGTIVLNLKTGGVDKLKIEGNNQNLDLFQKYSFSFDSIRGGYWCGGENNELVFLKLEVQGDLITAHLTSIDVHSGTQAVYMLNENELLIGGRKAIVKYRIDSNQMEEIYESSNNLKIRQFHKKHNGNIWATTNKGLLEIDDAGNIIAHYTSQTEDFKLNSEHIFDLLVDRDSNTWVATMGGLHFFNKDENLFQIITVSDGLPDNRVVGILEDVNGQLWLSTFNGLCRYNPKTGGYSNFFEEEGIAHNEFNHSSKIVTQDGLYIFGGINGLTTFHPEDISMKNENISPFRLTEFSTFQTGKKSPEVTSTYFKYLNDIIIDPSTKYFKFSFALLDFKNVDKHRYQWYLEGLENDWSSVSEMSHIQYNNVAPGSYIFHVRAANAKGVWSESIDVPIRVNQVFYKQWWFIAFCIVVVFFLLYRIYVYRLKERLKLEKLRTKIASDLHDEVGGVLTRIAIRADLLKSGILKRNEAELELTRISDESRTATSSMSDVIWSVDARKDTIGDMLDRMREHCQEMLSSSQIQYEFSIVDLNTEKRLPLEIRQNLYLILKEAVTNVAKHANAKRVEVYLQNDHNQFKMMIRDDGTNEKKPSGKKGQGLSNMMMRANRIGAEIRIESNHGYLIELNLRHRI